MLSKQNGSLRPLLLFLGRYSHGYWVQSGAISFGPDNGTPSGTRSGNNFSTKFWKTNFVDRGRLSTISIVPGTGTLFLRLE